MLLEEGVSLQDALDVIRVQQRGKAGRQLVEGLRACLRGGEPFSRALSRSRRHFKRHYVETVQWAEAGGSADRLALALRLLANDTSGRAARTTTEVDSETGYARWR